MESLGAVAGVLALRARMAGARTGRSGAEARSGWSDGMTASPRLWRQVSLGLRRVLYQQTTLSLAADGWYDRLAGATGREGWEIIRAYGGLVQLERPRVRLP